MRSSASSARTSRKSTVISDDDSDEIIFTQKTTSFRIGKATRHLKFVALESRQGLHWSIHEIEVKAGVDEAKVNKIKATAAQYRQEGVR